jgi:hypothetical protein
MSGENRMSSDSLDFAFCPTPGLGKTDIVARGACYNRPVGISRSYLLRWGLAITGILV